MNTEELRERNRSLISQLMKRQRQAERTTHHASQLTRQVDSLQSKLDRLTVTRNEPLILNGSDSITRANVNNNNITNTRWDSRQMDVYEPLLPGDISPSELSRSRSPDIQFTKVTQLSPPTRDTLSPRRHKVISPRTQEVMSRYTEEVMSPHQQEVMVTIGSPEESKSVRRRLAEEMSPQESPPMRGPRSPFRDSTNRDLLKTPKQKPWEQSLRFGATPKTILKHRKLIDSNVEVQSKFAHTPGWMDRAKHIRLKPKSPGKLGGSPRVKQNKKKPSSRKMPSVNKTAIEDLKGVSFLDEQPTALPAELTDPDVLRSVAGNMRPTTPTLRPLVEQGTMHTPAEPHTPTHIRDSMPTPASLSDLGPTPPTRPSDMSVTSKRRMMGYDWIAALLDQSNSVEEKIGGGDDHETYFKELREFRRVHRDECQNDAVSLPSGYGHLSLVDTEDISQPPPAPTSPNHRCIHSYAVNSRLYAEPVNTDRSGTSHCAVCNKKKQLASTTSPAFVRVSIPRSTLSSPYKVKPHRRKSFDPSDSVALSKHCLAGWVHQRPMKLPLGRNIDLANETNRLKSKFTMTMAEAEDLAKKSVPVHSRDLDQTTLYTREVKKITNQLLDMSHAMQFQSQLLNRTPIH